MRNLILVCLLPLMASTCKDHQPCIYSRVTFLNKSTDTIIYAYKYTKNGQCYLDGWKLAPQREYLSSPPICIDSIDDNKKVLEIFVADPTQFINHKMVPCDAVSQNYPVLKHYNLSENELRNAGFKIHYP
jgi:hypothetical protein